MSIIINSHLLMYFFRGLLFMINNYSANQMKTPFKLKRDAPSSLTTLDRTVLLSNRSSLHPKANPVQLLLSQPVAKPVNSVIEVERVNTSELQKQMARLMQEEETRSQRSRSGAKGGHCYFTRPLQSKLAVGATWSVPQCVKELYDRMSKGGRCEFNQGILPKVGLYYFAVRNIVLFFDIARAVRSAGRLEDHFAHKAEFDNTVYELKELSWKHVFFGQFKNRPIILVSQPWAISFAALEIEPGQGKGPRWMRITTLNSTFTHGSSIARCIVQGKLEIYFLDDSGKISCVSIAETDWMDYLFTKTTKRHKLQQRTKQLGGTSSFYSCRKATMFERLRHFSKVLLTKSFSFYGRRIISHDLIGDIRGNLLISLVDLDATSDRSALSAFKLLTCWERRNGKLQKKWEVSELEFFDKEIESIADHSNHHNYRIARIQAIDHLYDSQCSLIVFLNCGMRLYLKAEDSSKVVHYHLPPALDGPLHRKAQPKQHSKSLELGHCLSWWNINVMTLREEQGDSHTFLICRPKETREREECAELVWGNSMCRGKSGNPPEESQLTRLCLASVPKEKLEQAFATPVLHELVRGLFGLPEFLVNSTDQGVEYLCNLRPVDRVFAAILSTLDDEHVLMKVLTDLPEVEIQYLLLQIYCDPNGQYLKDFQLIDCITQYQRRLLTHGGEDFDPFQREFYEQRTQNKAEEDLLPVVIEREGITQQTQEKILGMILKLAKKAQGVAGHAKIEAELHATLCNAILLYVSRLLKKIWRTSIKQLTKSVQAILPMIYPLHQAISYFNTSAVTKTKLIPQSVASTRPFVRLAKEKQEETEKKNSGKGLKEMSSYLHKLTQLIILCSEVDINLDKSFSLALSLESESFEKPIFDFLIDKYEKPALSLVQYKKHFPSLIGENLEKSLKIFQQCKSKKKEEAVAILKYHLQIPAYLLHYYESKSVLRPEDIKEIRGLSSLTRPEKQRIDYSNVKDNIHTCLEELSKQGHDFSERALLILRASALLKHYLTRNDGKQDRFYRESHMQLEDVRRKVAFQELMLDEYKLMDKMLSLQVVMQLRTYLFDEERLYQLQDNLGSDYLTIIYFLLFRRVEADQKDREKVLECVQNILEQDCKEFDAESILKKALSYLQRKKDAKARWYNFNRLIKLIVKNTSSFPFELLINLLREAILRKFSSKLKEEVLRLGEVITRHGGKQRMLEVGKRMELPLISITLLEAGVQGSELNSYYEQWLRQRKGEQEGLLHSINLLFLTLRVEPRWEFLLANFKDICAHFEQPIGSILKASCKMIAEASGWNDSFS